MKKRRNWKRQKALNWFLVHFSHLLSHSIPHPPPTPFFLPHYHLRISHLLSHPPFFSPTTNDDLRPPNLRLSSKQRNVDQGAIGRHKLKLDKTMEIGATTTRYRWRCASRSMVAFEARATPRGSGDDNMHICATMCDGRLEIYHITCIFLLSWKMKKIILNAFFFSIIKSSFINSEIYIKKRNINKCKNG